MNLLPLPVEYITDEFINLRIVNYIDYKSVPGCHIWIGALRSYKTGPYPAIEINGKTYQVTRIIYYWHNKIDPGSLFVCHNCSPNPDDKRCINPEHLWLGSNSQNILDSFRKGRKPIAPRKFDSETIKDIKHLYFNCGYSQYRIARIYDSNQSTISRIINNQTYNNS